MPTTPGATEPIPSRNFGQTLVGVGMLGMAATGAGMIAMGVTNPESTIAVIAPGPAHPTDTLAELLDLSIELGAAAGVGALAGRGVHRIRIGMSDKQAAIHTIAHASSRSRKSILSAATAVNVSLLATGSAVMAGNFADIAHNAAGSQGQVVETLSGALNELVPHEGETFVISNTPRPELATSSTISTGAVQKIVRNAASVGAAALPAHLEWHQEYSNGGTGKESVLTAGLPSEIVGLPISDAACDDTEALTTPDMGFKIGDTFTLDAEKGEEGLKVRVAGFLDGKSGAGLLPIIFNNEDFARCIDNDPAYPYSVVLAQGQKEQVAKLLQEQGLDSHNLADRVFMVPLSQYEASTEQTGKNQTYPYVLQAIALGLLFGGAALSGRARNRIIEGRRENTVDEANGTLKKIITRIQAEQASSEAVASGLVAAPIVLVVDAFTNTGIPGGQVGPTATTLLFVIGSTWVANRLGTSIAMRREAPKINLVKGHNL